MINLNAIQRFRTFYADFDDAAGRCDEAFSNNVRRYLELKNLLHQVDVSTDIYFQRRVSHFYGLNQARLGPDRKAAYFRKLEDLKNTDAPIDIAALTASLERQLGKYHFSFCSKMADLINDEEYPIYDKNVKKHFRRRGLGYRHDYLQSIYTDITDTYRSLVDDPVITAFRKRYNAQDMGYMKVLDVLFWVIP